MEVGDVVDFFWPTSDFEGYVPRLHDRLEGTIIVLIQDGLSCGTCSFNPPSSDKH